MAESFPRQQARTRHFSLGVPRSFQISPDGQRVAFLRSKGGGDPVTCLWVLDVATGAEHLIADPAALGGADGELSEVEKARRERAREQAGGIVTYACDRAMNVAAFALGGSVHLVSLRPGDGFAPRTLPCASPAFDPRPDPEGRLVAYVCEGALRMVDLAAGEDVELIGPGGAEGVTYGLAEFIAAEEMGRMRGFWWAPDSSALLTARVDETGVSRWHIADPANPDRPARPVAYPAAGASNADVSLLLVGLDGNQAPVEWDRSEFPYLVAVSYDEENPLLVVQSRDQRRMRLLSADPARGAVAVLREDRDEHWVDVVAGVPAPTSDGRIVWTVDADGVKRLLVAAPEELAEGSAVPVTPASMHVREVMSVDGDVVLFTAWRSEPSQIGLWRHGPDGLAEVSDGPGVHGGRRSGGTTVIASQSLGRNGVAVRVLRDETRASGTGPGASEGAGGAPSAAARIASLAERPNLPVPRPELFAAGERDIPAALLLPSWHEPGAATLPVLLDPYGGPHAQRVLASRQAFLASQWFAEQGFAVLVADGRGTPGRGADWERAVARDLAGPVLDDQVAALEAARARCADLDLSRVAIRGWSFGGYLAALAVLRRPDVFHAAVAGAPVVDWRLYDTHYTERYLGQPGQSDPDPYQQCSLLPDADRLERPLLLIHGLADDNVVVAHTLRLSAALLAAGRPHTVLPLTGVTHMTPQEEVAENLLLLQLDFLRRSLGVAAPAPR